MSQEMVGLTIGRMKTTGFTFVINPDHEPSLFDYLMIEIAERGIKRECLCQVIDLSAYSPTATEDIPIEALERLISTMTQSKPHLLATAKMIGYKEGKDIIVPKQVPRPATKVYPATNEFLKTFFSIEEDIGLEIGHLISQPDFKAQIDVRGFNRHVAILGVTGCGKSNLTGVVLEELLARGGSIVVLDPHGDYSQMSVLESGEPYDLAHRIQVFSRAGIPFSVRLADFTIEDICRLAGIHEGMTRQEQAVRLAIGTIQNDQGEDYGFTIEDIVNELDRMVTEENDQHAGGARIRIQRLRGYDVLGTANTPLADFLQPQQISIIDLSGMTDRALQLISYLLLNRIYEARLNSVRGIEGEQFHRPVFVFLEEAQKFAPARQAARSSRILEIIASEGRKFGVFIVIISQRPNKVAESVLSMCNSQVIMRIINTRDQNTVRDTSEAIAEDMMADLPGLNVGEAVIVGSIVPAPMTVKIRKRKTIHAGADIDIRQQLTEARREAGQQPGQPLVEDVEGFV
jgi:DNA helicase HerA-like ATPase